MIPVSPGTRVWLCAGHTDMRKGWNSLSLLIQEHLKKDPHSGALYIFRGHKGDLCKLVWHDGQGACLFTKRLEKGKFVWPQTKGDAVALTPAQLGYLLEGIDWRLPERTWQPMAAG